MNQTPQPPPHPRHRRHRQDRPSRRRALDAARPAGAHRLAPRRHPLRLGRRRHLGPRPRGHRRRLHLLRPRHRPSRGGRDHRLVLPSGGRGRRAAARAAVGTERGRRRPRRGVRARPRAPSGRSCAAPCSPRTSTRASSSKRCRRGCWRSTPVTSSSRSSTSTTSPTWRSTPSPTPATSAGCTSSPARGCSRSPTPRPRSAAATGRPVQYVPVTAERVPGRPRGRRPARRGRRGPRLAVRRDLRRPQRVAGRRRAAGAGPAGPGLLGLRPPGGGHRRVEPSAGPLTSRPPRHFPADLVAPTTRSAGKSRCGYSRVDAVTVGSRAPRKKMPGKPARLEAVAGVAAQGRALDRHRAGAVVADEEDGAAALVGVVVLDDRAGDVDGEEVAVGVDGAAAAAAGRAGPGRVGARCRSPVLWLSTLLSTTHETPMLLSAPPFEHSPPCPARRRRCCSRRTPAGPATG